MHIYYYDNVTFEDAMATAQPPQFQLASYPSYFVLQEIPSILISPSFEYFYNDASVFRGKSSCPVQLGQQVQNCFLAPPVGEHPAAPTLHWCAKFLGCRNSAPARGPTSATTKPFRTMSLGSSRTPPEKKLLFWLDRKSKNIAKRSKKSDCLKR